VLKEMVKSSQTQLKQKEAELIFMRKKLQNAEAQSLAAKKVMNSNQSLP